MGECLIVRRDCISSLEETSFAIINVIYPEGSTCTCTNGTKILVAKDTSGEEIFNIPEPETLPETWTVTCTNGTDIKSQSVSITTEGQFEEIILTYELVLFDGGDITDITGGWGTEGHGSEVLTNNTKVGVKYTGSFNSGTNAKTWAVFTLNAIDITGYTTLKVNITSVSGKTKGISVHTSSGTDAEENYVATSTVSGAGEVSLSLEGLSGSSYYVYLWTTQGGGYASSVNRYIYADRIWLE